MSRACCRPEDVARWAEVHGAYDAGGEGGDDGGEGDVGGGGTFVDVLHAMLRTEDDDVDDAAVQDAAAAAARAGGRGDGEERAIFASSSARSVRRGVGAMQAAIAMGMMGGIDPSMLEQRLGGGGGGAQSAVLQVRDGVADYVAPPAGARPAGGGGGLPAGLEFLEAARTAARGGGGGEQRAEMIEAMLMARMAAVARGGGGRDASVLAASAPPAGGAAPTSVWVEFSGGQRIIVGDAPRLTVADCMLGAHQLDVADVPGLWSKVYSLSFGTVPRSLAPASRRGRAFLHDVGAAPRSLVVRAVIDAAVARATGGPAAGGAAMDSGQVTPARLLLVLHGLASWWPRRALEAGDAAAAAESARALGAIPWRNERVTGHVLRELADPVAVCTGAVLHACGAIATMCPFLLPLGVRQRLYDMTAFGVSRALCQLEEAGEAARRGAHPRVRAEPRERRFVGAQQKCELPREGVLRSAMALLRHAGTREAELSVQFIGETGHGLGPTIEFYTLVCRELQVRARACRYEFAYARTAICIPVCAAHAAYAFPDARACVRRS